MFFSAFDQKRFLRRNQNINCFLEIFLVSAANNGKNVSKATKKLITQSQIKIKLPNVIQLNVHFFSDTTDGIKIENVRILQV